VDKAASGPTLHDNFQLQRHLVSWKLIRVCGSTQCPARLFRSGRGRFCWVCYQAGWASVHGSTPSHAQNGGRTGISRVLEEFRKVGLGMVFACIRLCPHQFVQIIPDRPVHGRSCIARQSQGVFAADFNLSKPQKDRRTVETLVSL